jgi:NADH-quinone oxidoreductase subunit A
VGVTCVTTITRLTGTPERGRGYATAVDGYLGSYASLGLLLAAGVLVFSLAMTANRLLRTNRPSAAKSTTYESGVDPVGGDWAQAQIRYYVYAFLYVMFAVEAVFLFPWAVVFSGGGGDQRGTVSVAAVVEMGIFVGVLALGLLYAWRKRVLTWT